jgi:hypothetical protein
VFTFNEMVEMLQLNGYTEEQARIEAVRVFLVKNLASYKDSDDKIV